MFAMRLLHAMPLISFSHARIVQRRGYYTIYTRTLIEYINANPLPLPLPTSPTSATACQSTATTTTIETCSMDMKFPASPNVSNVRHCHQ